MQAPFRSVVVGPGTGRYRRSGMSKDAPAGATLIVDNRKARHKFEVLETFEAGIVLRGTEVKSLRDGKAHLDEAFARIIDVECYLVGAHIDEYAHGNRENHPPTRRRKLLLKKGELRKLEAKVKEKGFTIVPVKLFLSERGFAKLEIALARGKKTHDKRSTIRERDVARDMDREKARFKR